MGKLEDRRAVPALERAAAEDEGWFEPTGEPVAEAAEEALVRIREARDGDNL